MGTQYHFVCFIAKLENTLPFYIIPSKLYNVVTLPYVFINVCIQKPIRFCSTVVHFVHYNRYFLLNLICLLGFSYSPKLRYT